MREAPLASSGRGEWWRSRGSRKAGMPGWRVATHHRTGRTCWDRKEAEAEKPAEPTNATSPTASCAECGATKTPENNPSNSPFDKGASDRPRCRRARRASGCSLPGGATPRRKGFAGNSLRSTRRGGRRWRVAVRRAIRRSPTHTNARHASRPGSARGKDHLASAGRSSWWIGGKAPQPVDGSTRRDCEHEY